MSLRENPSSKKAKCAKCGGNMIEGFLPSAPHWKAGKGMLGKTYRIFGYRCEKCGYVEFYVKETSRKKELEL